VRTFVVVLDPDEEDGGYTVTVPALPGCITQGETLDDALAMAQDAIAGYLESMAAHGESIPVDPVGEQLAQVGTIGIPAHPLVGIWKPVNGDPTQAELAIVQVDIGGVAPLPSR
jgi:antitoxin HicB